MFRKNRTKTISLMIALLATVVLTADDAAQDSKSRPLLFHLSFENGLDAKVANGTIISPTASNKVKIVEGVKGMGLEIETDGFLAFSAKGIFPMEIGSIEMYVKPLYSSDDNAFRCYFTLSGEAYNIDGYRLERGVIKTLNFTIFGHDKRGISVSAKPECLITGQWTHLKASWDLKSKKMSLSINGLEVNSKECPDINIEKIGETIYFGACGGGNTDRRSCVSVLDEIKIYGGEK